LVVPSLIALLAACGDRIGLHQSEQDGPTGTTVGGGPSDAAEAGPPPFSEDGGPPSVPDVPRGDGGYVPDTEATASTLQINAAHTGFVDDATLAGPIVRLWSKTLAAPTGYAVIARGLVIVGYTQSSPVQFVVEAYGARKGNLVWQRVVAASSPFDRFLVGLAYDGGRVFVLGSGGGLHALDVASGALLWVGEKVPQYSFSSAPAAYKGTLYVGGTGGLGTVYGIDESNGLVVAHAEVQDGFDSSPAISDDGVFVAYACLQAYRFDLLSQVLGWHHMGSCVGGGGATVVLANGFVYARDGIGGAGNTVLSAATGAPLSSFLGTTMPAFHGSDGYFVQTGLLTKAGPSGGWSFAANTNLLTPPIVVGGRVFVGSSSGRLFGIDEATGAATFTDDVGVPFSALQEEQPQTLSAAQGVIVAPAGNKLFVYGAPDPGDGGAD
jgi:outer membrane protein assembly factor BamB